MQMKGFVFAINMRRPIENIIICFSVHKLLSSRSLSSLLTSAVS